MKDSMALSLLILILISCEKDTKTDWNNIIVGDETEAIIVNIYDTIEPVNGFYTQNLFDINKDDVNDLEITAYLSWSHGQSLASLSTIIKPLNNCSIITDTTKNNVTKDVKIISNGESQNSEVFYDSIFVTVPMLKDGYLIDDNQNWHNDLGVRLCFSFDRLRGDGNPIYIWERHKYIGWSVATKKSLGFRIQTSTDTTYGYLEIEISDYNRIIVKRSLYR